ncbi:MAG: hypothetical protein V7K25_17860 [Nostoc sp.]
MARSHAHQYFYVGDRISFLHSHNKSLEEEAIALAQPDYISDRIPFY